MTRNIAPADSASNVSTNRGSMADPQPAQGQQYGDGSCGSMPGRAPPIINKEYALALAQRVSQQAQQQPFIYDLDDVSTRGSGSAGDSDRRFSFHFVEQQQKQDAPKTTGSAVVGGQRVPSSVKNHASGAASTPHHSASMAPIQEESNAGHALTEENISQLNRGMEGMGINNRAQQSQLQASNSSTQAVPATQPNEDTMDKRYVTLTWNIISTSLLYKLRDLFQVRTSKVKDWLKERLIRVDLQRWEEDRFPYDIELLPAQLAFKDIEKWDNFIREYDSFMELREAIGPCGGVCAECAGSLPSSRREVWASDTWCPECPACRLNEVYCGGEDPDHLYTTKDSKEYVVHDYYDHKACIVDLEVIDSV